MSEINSNCVTVVYALPDYQHKFEVAISTESSPSLTILDVINQSGILEYYPEIDLSKNTVGVFSEVKKLTDFVKSHDRIEIYRPLILEPTEARKLRTLKKSVKNKNLSF